MLPIALEELSLKKILITDTGAKALRPSTIRLEALRTLQLLDIFHPMLEPDTFPRNKTPWQKKEKRKTPQRKPPPHTTTNDNMTNTSTAMDTNLAGPAGTMILDAPPNAAATSAKTTKRKRPNALEREDGELDDEGGAHEGESQGDPRTTNPTSNPRPPPTKAPNPPPT
ncbi:hypothetical protein PC9H_011148 [Pleurotus ostreatus]|uniref:Uncharacterized protein n=1 Tax=Pleurotus ostreatus TaxID=5322 RepID=A0A8H7DPB9_PLEOS|nr:uncharacterized protein PC9H_011148 [Pleurotus ostreatus]KAF7422984.1 hypothetical protein PC9H_011148 [Pleurotus ostreatus]